MTSLFITRQRADLLASGLFAERDGPYMSDSKVRGKVGRTSNVHLLENALTDRRMLEALWRSQ